MGEKMPIPDPALVAGTVKQVLTTARVRTGVACEHLCTVILLRVTEDMQAKLLVQWPDAWKNPASVFSFFFCYFIPETMYTEEQTWRGIIYFLVEK